MSTYSDESDLSGDETLDDIGNFDIVNLPREEINNRERQFGTLPGSSDEIQIFEGFEPEDAPDFAIWDIFFRALIIYASNLYSCIDNLIPFQLMYNTLIYIKK